MTRTLKATAIAAIASLALAAPAAAKKFEVTARTDPAPDGCTTQECSLREAVLAANARSGPDRVVLPKRKTYNLSIDNSIPPGEDEAAEGDLDITDTLRVTHPGKGRAKVDANGIDRVFELFEGGSTIWKRIVVTGGVAPPNPASDGGGGIRATDSDVTLRRSSVLRNLTEADFGGGIELVGDAGLAARRSAISYNRSAEDSGAVEAGAGPISIARSKLVGNVASASGGALYLDTEEPVRIIRSTIADNQAQNGPGGGIDLNNGTLSVQGSTIAGNSTTSNGGGIVSFGELTVVNSTVAGNRADVNGGGIFSQGDASLNAVTTVRNSAGEDGGGLLYAAGGPGFAVANSLVALNSAGDFGDDCTGEPFYSRGHNLLGTDADCNGFDAEGDFANPNPKIGQLKNNGGLTQTVKLKKGSPAINNADKQSAPNKDQRGEKRGRKPDIGAYERIKKNKKGGKGRN